MPGDERDRRWATAPRPHRVVERRTDGPGRVTLSLTPASPPKAGADRPATRPLPGQYWVLDLEGGVQVPAVDVTDLTEACGDAVVQVTTLRVPCGQTMGVVGDLIEVRGPMGAGWDLESVTGRDLVLIGWDTGVALLSPLVEQAEARGVRSVRMWAGGCERWLSRPEWRDLAGRDGVRLSPGPDMSAAAGELDLDPGNTIALVAGPWPMACDTARALIDRGLPAASVQLAAHSFLRCGNRRCGRCRLAPSGGVLRACLDGPVLAYDRIMQGA
ncbi:hypothetical protein [Nonomuraea cavernae]|uniref:hypothetical protein n=1 Tax=Nonomuraea cavernae TaxID=2045107 RepID=UPI001665F208|nr:hypothetical protein [Nonomuraea cavernae]MCA2183764.1 hypothetical protein [Nonomuraea cavernae]